jgi:hypothetical protein
MGWIKRAMWEGSKLLTSLEVSGSVSQSPERLSTPRDRA